MKETVKLYDYNFGTHYKENPDEEEDIAIDFNLKDDDKRQNSFHDENKVRRSFPK